MIDTPEQKQQQQAEKLEKPEKKKNPAPAQAKTIKAEKPAQAKTVKAEKPAPPQAPEDEKTVRLNVEITLTEMAQLKMHSAATDVPVREIIRELIANNIPQYGKISK